MGTAPPTEIHVLVRVWLPDRPGALGLVASRIGAVGADIVGVDVVERGERVAVDEFAVVVPDDGRLDLMVREIEQVDGASVEEVRRVGIFPDPRLDALESAAELCEADSIDNLQNTLAAHVRREFLADWVALLQGERVLASDGDVCPTSGSSWPSRPGLRRRRWSPTAWSDPKNSRSLVCRHTNPRSSWATPATCSAVANARSS